RCPPDQDSLMSYARQPLLSSFALFLMMALTACGGGGGGGAGGTPAAIGSPPPAPTAPGASAAAGTDPVPGGGLVCTQGEVTSTRSATFALVNLTRFALGLPQLARLTALDGTAQAHAQYAVANEESGVTESYGLPCFTGVDLAQRLAAAGVVSTDLPGLRQRSEIVVGFAASANAEPQPLDYINDALNNLYGRTFLLDPRMQQVGLGFSAEPGGLRRTLVLDMALRADTPAANAEVWAVWPRDGATGLPTRMRPSNIKPLAAGLVEGYPVTLHAAAPVGVTRFVMSTASDGSAVETTVLTAANDGNLLLAASEVALVPNAPLAAGTTYRVEFDGSVGMTPLHLAWSFTTAP
ncbi:hypothetical protein, partial [Roseateles sp.]|uniref:hypothetical protein n=1 Tax=Roseateles sp. TaxID=1971397 RepID=UPI003264513C